MAATVQLTIQTNEQQVRASLNAIQQQINQMVNKPYTIQINTQFSPQGVQNLQNILNVTNSLRMNSNVTIHVNTVNNSAVLNDLRQIDNGLTLINNNMERGQGNAQTFGLALNRAFQNVRKYANEALSEMKKVDTELITIQKVTNESAEGMKRYADDAYEVASRLGAGASEYLNAVAEFAKAGYGQHAKELGELAITAAKVGDTTQSMANQFLLSVDAAYKYEGSIEKLTAVLDGANEIGNKFPTSVDKIAQGLGKVSPIAAQAHVGIDELTAAIGTITAVTQRSGTEAATALRALFLNIMGDTKTEIEDGAKWTAGEIEGLRDLLKEYAPEVVKAADATKTLINPMEAIAALSKAMGDGFLTEQKLMDMVSDIGGKLRSSQLLALIQNFDKYQKMLDTYRNSAGSAAQEYSIYLDSWEAKTNQLAATWTDFVQRKLGTDQIKDLLDALIKIVDNLDNWVPLIGGIASAIALVNIPNLIRHVSTLLANLGPLGIAITAVSVALGAGISAWNQYSANIQKAAQESLDNAKKQGEEVTKMQELAAQYAIAAENSDDFKKASENIRTALENEGFVVANLTETYKALMIAKSQAWATEANTAYEKAKTNLQTAYGSGGIKGTKGRINLGGWELNMGGDSFLSGVSSRLKKSGALRVNERLSKGVTSLYYEAADSSATGIAAYYDAIALAMNEVEIEAYRLRAAGDEAGSSKLLNSSFYLELSGAVEDLGDSWSLYASARDEANEADISAKGVAEYYSALETIQERKMTQAELSEFIRGIKESTVLSESMKKIILSSAGEAYPQFAEALGIATKGYEAQAEAATKAAEATKEATSALSKFQEATKKGSEKDDPFKSYKEVYDTVMKEAKKGRYGSNAFQYGIKALLDPEYIKKFNGDWNALVKDMQKSLGGLYADADSMGVGLLDKIAEAAGKAKGSLYEIYDGDKILAAYDKKTGKFQITEDPEGIKILASKVGMSAESLIAGAMALGAIDPNADLTGLNEALKNIISEGTEDEPSETAKLEAETANKNAGTVEVFSNAVNTFAEIMAAEAKQHDKDEQNRNTKPAQGPSDGKHNPQYTEAGADLMDKHDGVYVRADNGNTNPPIPVVNTGVEFGPTREDYNEAMAAAEDRAGAMLKWAATQALTFALKNGTASEADIDAIEEAIDAAEQADIEQVAKNRASRSQNKAGKLQTSIDKLAGSNTPIGEAWGGIDQAVGGSQSDTSASRGWFIDALFGKGTFSRLMGSAGSAAKGLTFSSVVDTLLGVGKEGTSTGLFPGHTPTNAVTNAEEQGLVVHPGAGALISANDRFTAWMYERYGVKPIVTGSSGTTAYRPGGTPNHHRVAPDDTFNGTGQWFSQPEPITVTGAVAEGVKEGLELVSGTNAEPVFRGTGAFASPSEIPDAVAEGVEQGIEASSNKDTAAYHNGYRGGIPFGDFNASQFGMAHPTGGGSLILDVLGGLFGGVAAGSVAEVAVDNSQAQESIEETKSALEEIDNTEAEAEASLDPSGAEEGAAAAKAAIESIPTLVSSSVLINVDINTTRHGLGAGGNSGGDWVKETRASGDEYFHGGPVLVNDEAGGWNPELIVANGRAFIANGGDPAVLNLPRGARIFSASETRDIINGGEDLLNIPSYAEGTDYGLATFLTKVTPVSGKKKKKKSSDDDGGSSGSGSSGSSSKKFDDDMMKKLEQYMADILDAAEDALNDQLEAINAQIYALKYQTEAAEKATALEEARLQLLEAEKNLLDANTERTVRYYNAATGQWEWMADQREVNRAQEELYDAQKNLLEAEYDALATAWKELKDEISKALENNEEIDINAILTALGKSAASGSLPALKTLIGDIGTYTDDPRAVANFDGGGLARGLGWMPKGTAGTEAVLDSALTSAILHPQMNQAFSSFTDSLTTLFNLAGGTSLPSSRYGGNVSNMYGGNTYIEGVKIGSDMLNRPLSEVLSTLNLYVHN